MYTGKSKASGLEVEGRKRLRARRRATATKAAPPFNLSLGFWIENLKHTPHISTAALQHEAALKELQDREASAQAAEAALRATRATLRAAKAAAAKRKARGAERSARANDGQAPRARSQRAAPDEAAVEERERAAEAAGRLKVLRLSVREARTALRVAREVERQAAVAFGMIAFGPCRALVAD